VILLYSIDYSENLAIEDENKKLFINSEKIDKITKDYDEIYKLLDDNTT